MADATYVARYEEMNYTPVGTVSAGDLIWNSDDTLLGIAKNDIAAGVEGT